MDRTVLRAPGTALLVVVAWVAFVVAADGLISLVTNREVVPLNGAGPLVGPLSSLVAALSLAVLLLSGTSARGRSWLPLVAGAAMRDAVAAVLPDDAPVAVKWPNDVLVAGRKVCGILCQIASDGSVVVGAGVNLDVPEEELPTPIATSLTLEGARGDAPDLADRVFVAFRAAVLEAVGAVVAAGPAAESVRSAVRAACDTIGRRVRVELPDGSVVEADATGIDDEGRLLVSGAGGLTAVSVGDVTHLRYA